MSGIGWRFENSYTALPPQMYTRLNPVEVAEPELVILNHTLAKEMGLDFSKLSSQGCAELFTGNRIPEGADPLAQAYGGHQFGHFSILGDGRAIVLGEHLTPAEQRLDIQFKGSGQTPYSRNGDGRAALGPMLREYLISEAMHQLGIPTTRSLAVATTGETVFREELLPGAILTRVAASHLRVGTFQLLSMQKQLKALESLLAYALKRHEPNWNGDGNPALALLKGVMDRQLDLVIHWLRVGFIHGVMNTDNMTISGETIDYGPCAFMDRYALRTVFSSIDHAGRYAYGNQPLMIKWNIARLAEALLPLLHEEQPQAIKMAEEAIEAFNDQYKARWMAMMRSKLGLEGDQEGDNDLFGDLLNWMEQHSADYTNTFCSLMAPSPAQERIYQEPVFQGWLERWQQRRQRQPMSLADSLLLMQQHNPQIIPRNHHVEEALKVASDSGDLEPLQQLLEALQDPYTPHPKQAPFQDPPSGDAERVYQTFCGT
uniref:Protein nucleotidyltransferase YdiU n=1 Tax=Magnetococcus massalia (strain MO-1) TaxID=451514 RepID=A0A1S7LJX9_MAGMO|nr:conserved protein of unknown function [Candidatus Magnetococcus massalia]